MNKASTFLFVFLILGSMLLAKTEFFHWEYKSKNYTIEAGFSEKTYRFYRQRTRDRDYSFYATDSFDDKLITNFAKSINKLSQKNELSTLDELYLVVAFIQSLPYTTDSLTTGVGEYPRIPYETLYEKGGDCEDTAILAAAIFREMGYDSVLIQLEQHMALAVNLEEGQGDHYLIDGKKFYYLETTGSNWALGEIPEEYRGQTAIPLPLVIRPSISINAEVRTEYSDDPGDPLVNVTVTVELKNLGSAPAEEMQLYVFLESHEESKVYDQYLSPEYQLDEEESMTIIKRDLHAVKNSEFRIVFQAVQDSLIIGELAGEWISAGE
jgi:predicted transglutaminase-like cysteine proteinase